MLKTLRLRKKLNLKRVEEVNFQLIWQTLSEGIFSRKTDSEDIQTCVRHCQMGYFQSGVRCYWSSQCDVRQSNYVSQWALYDRKLWKGSNEFPTSEMMD